MILTEGLMVQESPKSPEGPTSSLSTSLSEARLVYDSPPPYYGSTSDSGVYTRLPPDERVPLVSSHRWRARNVYRMIIAVILVVFGGFQVLYLWDRWKRNDERWDPGPVLSYPIPTNISLQNCTSTEGWMNIIRRKKGWTPPFSAETMFDLPLNDNTLLFLSKGTMSAGTLRVLLDSNMRGDRAVVRVYVNYINDWARDLSRVCRIARVDNDGESGVGIFSPQFPSPLPLEAQLSFDIIVWLPRSSSHRVMIIKGLKADLYESALHFGDLSTYMFEAVEFQSTESNVDVEAVSAERVSIITTNARVSGKFNITDSLHINASKSDVFIDAELTSSSSIAPNVVLSTSGRSLYANFTLVSATTAGGAFSINVTANHGDSKVLFPAQPLDSKLSFVSSMMNNSQATVKFHPTYEGSFDIRGGSVNVWNDPTIDDPSGRHRWRTFQSQRSDDHLSGSTAWQQDHKGYGQVRIVSTNSRLDVAF